MREYFEELVEACISAGTDYIEREWDSGWSGSATTEILFWSDETKSSLKNLEESLEKMNNMKFDTLDRIDEFIKKKSKA